MISVLTPTLVVVGLVASPVALMGLVLWRAHRGHQAAGGDGETAA